MADLAVGRLALGKAATLLEVVYVQPRIDHPGDFRLLGDVDLLLPLTDAMKLQVSAEWRHDSRPPESVLPDDVSLRSGISILLP